jgi:hypothetical protein
MILPIDVEEIRVEDEMVVEPRSFHAAFVGPGLFDAIGGLAEARSDGVESAGAETARGMRSAGSLYSYNCLNVEIKSRRSDVAWAARP